jgi:general stress protein 26
MTDDQVAAFLAGARVARLASHNPDGSIHLAPAWFLYDGGYILIGTQSASRKARNVAADYAK